MNWYNMRYNMLGNTGIEVSELCLGTLIYGTLQSRMSPTESEPAIKRAIDCGINFFDTAKGYATYEHLRIGLDNFPNAVIASKSPVKTAQEMRTDVESCLRALRRETIDIFHLHLIKSIDDLHERTGALESLIKCKKEGLIRHIGISSHSIAGARSALKCADIEVVMPILNKRGLGIADGSRDEMVDAIRELRASGRAVYDMKALAGGHLIGDIPSAIEYVRDLDVFDSIAVGMKTAEEVEVMVGIFEGDLRARERALDMGRDRAGKKRLIVYDFICERCGSCISSCAQNALSMGEKAPVIDESLCILCGYCGESCPKFAIRVI
jgi:ferredoxin